MVGWAWERVNGWFCPGYMQLTPQVPLQHCATKVPPPPERAGQQSASWVQGALNEAQHTPILLNPVRLQVPAQHAGAPNVELQAEPKPSPQMSELAHWAFPGPQAHAPA